MNRSSTGSGKKVNFGVLKETCAYPMHNCLQQKFENYEYCFRHILEDKTAPYKQCGFVNGLTGRKCGNPAPKSYRKDNAHCSEHVRKAQIRHQKQLNRPQPPYTAESLLASIGHYINPNKIVKIQNDDETSTATSLGVQDLVSSETGEKEQPITTKCLNPFVEIDATIVNSTVNQVLDYCSESDSDIDVTTVDDVLRVKDEDSSDAESIDSAGEDLFKYAGVFTSEEIIIRAKDKLQRLQNLYIEQFKHLQHELKECRREYLTELSKEKETLCSISNQPRDTLRERCLYQKLKHLNRYHRKHGVEAILHKKTLEKRACVTEGIQPKTTYSKCIYTEGGVKCLLRTLPCAKYCNKHILEDPNQKLFKKCGAVKSDSVCQEPVMYIYNNDNCIYHYNIPPVTLAYNTSISSDEDDKTDVKHKQVGRSPRDRRFKNFMRTPKQSPVHKIKTEIKSESPLHSSDFLNESLKGTLFTVREKLESNIKIEKDVIDCSEQLPLQIMASREMSQEEIQIKDESFDIKTEETVYFPDEEYVISEECVTVSNV